MENLLRRDRTAGLEYEQLAIQQGYRHIAGLDEAGRGPWAGPVAAAAVMLPPEQADLAEALKGARDSKQMTPRQRQQRADIIRQTALTWGIGSASVAEIERIGIASAVRLAFQRALDACQLAADYLLIDYMPWPQNPLPQRHLTRGDTLSLSIACASILAKTWRDDLMTELHQQYPQYGFDAHKGYGTAAHRAALARYGALDGVHRATFAPIRALQATS